MYLSSKSHIDRPENLIISTVTRDKCHSVRNAWSPHCAIFLLSHSRKQKKQRRKKDETSKNNGFTFPGGGPEPIWCRRGALADYRFDVADEIFDIFRGETADRINIANRNAGEKLLQSEAAPRNAHFDRDERCKSFGTNGRTGSLHLRGTTYVAIGNYILCPGLFCPGCTKRDKYFPSYIPAHVFLGR